MDIRKPQKITYKNKNSLVIRGFFHSSIEDHFEFHMSVCHSVIGKTTFRIKVHQFFIMGDTIESQITLSFSPDILDRIADDLLTQSGTDHAGADSEFM